VAVVCGDGLPIDLTTMLRSLGLVLLGLAFLTVTATSGNEPLEASLEDLQGRTHHLSDYRGKWVIVNFWATWCPPCIEEIPELVLFHDAHEDTDAVVLGINYERIDRDALDTFMEDFLVSYPQFQLSPDEPTPFGRIRAMPTTFLIDPAGRLAARAEGAVDREALERFIADYAPPGRAPAPAP
jgi:thiol-disulfide isomerase/thioredoxin